MMSVGDVVSSLAVSVLAGSVGTTVWCGEV